MAAWLDNLEAGDEVAVTTGYYSVGFARVERTTKTLIVLPGDRVFSRRYGSERGYFSGLRPEIQEPSDLLRERYRSFPDRSLSAPSFASEG